MSLILDALNRADKERSEQQLAPSLHPSAIHQYDSGSPLLWWVIAAVIVICAGIFFWFHFNAIPSVSTTNAKNTAANIEPASLPTKTDTASFTEQPAEVASNAPAATKTPAVGISPAHLPLNKSVISELYRQQATVTKEVVKPAEPPIIKKPTDNSAASSTAILQQIPLLATLPERFQRSVPSIEYSMHVYNKEDGSGMVNLNGKLCRIGSEIAPGLRLVAILADSIVLDYNGTHFRLLALNSWMNF